MLAASIFLALSPSQRNTLACKAFDVFLHCQPSSKDPQPHTPLTVTAILTAEHLHVDIIGDIRLLGVTIPVANQARARIYLKNYVLGKKVIVTLDHARTNTDDNNTLPPAWVLLDDGTLLNARLIQEGLARPWLSPGPWREWSSRDPVMFST